MIDNYIDSFKGKRVAFIGVGVSNMPIIERFALRGIEVSVRDRKDARAGIYGARLAELKVRLFCGEGYLSDIYEEVLFLSPAVRADKPELIAAAERGTLLTSEMQAFFDLCPCRTIAVTGSDGKTTTTTLIAKLLEADGKRVHLGGNIGKNLFIALDDIREGDFAVAELSSFQLMKLKISPDVAVITNVAPNHLDWHKDMAEYVGAKRNIYLNQKERSVLVLNSDNAATRDMISSARGVVCDFGHGTEPIINIREDGIYFADTLLVKNGDILLPGEHNRENYAAAIAATGFFISPEVITQVSRNFGGVEHRIERVRVLDGVTYYNSSIDSSPSRTKAALCSFSERVIVICGGYDKKIPLEPLGELFEEKAKAVVLMGDTADKIRNILNERGYGRTVVRAADMREAVSEARRLARAGDTVILSPAAASFDLYENFAKRGEDFKAEVMRL